MPDAAADLRAEALLRSVLAPALLEELDAEGHLTVTGSLGGRYRIRRGRAGNIELLDEEGAPKERLCIHPVPDIPNADTVLSQVLMVWTNEALFLEVANRSLMGGRPAAPDPRQRLQESLFAFVEEIRARREAGHELEPHDDPYRLCRGFEDRTADEWVVVFIRHLRTPSDEDGAPLGLTGSELRAQLNSSLGIYTLLGRDFTEARLDLISRSLETEAGREALAQALGARLRYGGPMPPEVEFEVRLLAEQLFEYDDTPGTPQLREALGGLETP